MTKMSIQNKGVFINDECLGLEPTLLLDEADVLEVPLAVGLRAAEAARAPRLPHRGDERPPEIIDQNIDNFSKLVSYSYYYTQCEPYRTPSNHSLYVMYHTECMVNELLYPLSVLHTTQTLSEPGGVSVATAANLLGSLLLLMLSDNSMLLVFADRLVGFRGCGVPDLDLSAMKFKQATNKVCYGKYKYVLPLHNC